MRLMLFFNPKILIFIKRHSIEIYDQAHDLVIPVKIPSTALQHLEIVNKNEFSQTIVEALKELDLQKQPAVIALSEHILFEKTIPAGISTDNDKLIQQFYHNVPLEENKIAKKIIPMDNKQLLLAANREVFQTIANLVEEFEWKIKAVIPMFVYPPVDETLPLRKKEVEQILGTFSDYESADFLKEDQIRELPVEKPKPETTPAVKEVLDSVAQDSSESEEVKENPQTKSLVTLAVFIICLGLIAASLFYFKIVTLPESITRYLPATASPSVSPSASLIPPSASPEASSSAQDKESSPSSKLNKSEVKIHVLNGSGISGQAAKLKQKLVEAGFENVVTGNIQGAEASRSSITYAPRMDSPMKDQINTLIDALIGESQKIDDGVNEFDVIVILGKLEKAIE